MDRAVPPSQGTAPRQGDPLNAQCYFASLAGKELTAMLAELPAPTASFSPEASRALGESWREGLSQKVTLCADRPPLRRLLVMDNLTGHKSPGWLVWCFQRGILPLFTPLGGSWLNMAESIQRILQRRALAGQYPLESRPLSPGLQRRQWAGIGIRLPWYGEANAPCVVNVPANGDSIAWLALALAPHGPSSAVGRLFEWLQTCQLTH
jgi:hypothetical protein